MIIYIQIMFTQNPRKPTNRSMLSSGQFCMAKSKIELSKINILTKFQVRYEHSFLIGFLGSCWQKQGFHISLFGNPGFLAETGVSKWNYPINTGFSKGT